MKILRNLVHPIIVILLLEFVSSQTRTFNVDEILDGTKLCNGNLVVVDSDPLNCGDCDVICSNNEICSAGACACDSGYNLCGNNCLNLNTDVNNCGSCENVCITGTSCIEGVCVAPDGFKICNGNLVVIDSDFSVAKSNHRALNTLISL